MTAHGSDSRARRLEQAIALKQAQTRTRGVSLPPRPTDHPPRLGEMQRSLWLLHQLDPSSPAYNLASAFRPSGSVAPTDLERSLNQVVSRHRLLRSTFRARRDAVMQVVHPHVPVPVEVMEVEGGAVLTTAVGEARKPFDLETGPLIRMRIIEVPSTHDRLVLLVVHHILADERSLGRLWRELAEAYAGQPPETSDQRQFDDYVYWQTQRGRSDRERELDYWQRKLTPPPDDVALPTARPTGDGRGRRGRLLRQTVGGPVQQDIRRLATATGATPFLVCAFAFRLLLERYDPGRSIAFATPVSTRSHPAAADMIGYFLNPVVLGGSADEGRSVAENVEQFARETRERLAHAALPFDVLAEALAPPRQPGRHPIFQVMFVFQETPTPPTLGDLHLEPVALDLGESKFDLTLFVSQARDTLEVAVEYRADRFGEIGMRNLLGHYATLLTHLADDPGRPAAGVPMLTPAEERRLLTEWQGAAFDPNDHASLLQQILERTRCAPDAPAVVCGGAVWRYDQLRTVAWAVARRLSASGVAPGDRVGLFVDRSAWLVAGVLGTHWAGAAYVPLDPGYLAARNGALLEDAAVTTVLTTAALRRRLPAGPWEPVCLDALDAPTVVDHRGADDVALPPLSPASPAYILYTSGSTGHPKGVLVTHGNLSTSTAARLAVYDSPPERFLLLPSIAFDSSVAGIFWTLSSGGTLVVPTETEARDPCRLATLAAEARVTTLLCVPSLYGPMVRSAGDRLQGLTTAIVACERCSSRLVREHFRVAPHVRLLNEYGPTETTVWATVHEITERDAEQSVPIGRPIPGVQVHVLDGRGRAVPAGVPGQAWIAGPTVAQGYWKRPSLTRERFVVDAESPDADTRMYRTGDRVAWTTEGTLRFLGRDDDQVKLRGFRIELGEIEAVLVDQPEVEEAAVVVSGLGAADSADADPEDPTQLVAFLHTVGDRRDITWQTAVERRLPSFMVPGRYIELPELPRSPNGKIDRGQLREMALEPLPPRASESQPVTELEQVLVTLWEGLLRRVGIGVADNFFELEGHSLLVVAMTDVIERDHGVILAASDVFQHPTVRELARRIADRGPTDVTTYAHLFPIQPGGRGTPFIFAIPHVFSTMTAERFRGERPVYGLRGVGLRPDGNLGRWRTMTDLGEELVDEILRRFPQTRPTPWPVTPSARRWRSRPCGSWKSAGSR